MDDFTSGFSGQSNMYSGQSNKYKYKHKYTKCKHKYQFRRSDSDPPSHTPPPQTSRSRAALPTRMERLCAQRQPPSDNR